MQYISTRNKNVSVTGETAIVSGICSSGGLFVPKIFPKVSHADLKKLACMDYYERAAYILHLFLPDFDLSELKAYCDKVYSNRFGLDPTPIKSLKDAFVLELWHGPTLAFKDFALQMLPYLLDKSKKSLGEKRVSLVLTATSGDTGAATIEGFKDIDGVKLAVFYPFDGVSKLQALQMTTASSPNVSVFSIKGNFDDAQSAVKKVFKDKDFNEELEKGGMVLTSANSINLGRLLPQIVYYFSAFVDLATYGFNSLDEEINFCVPSGNAGNILAGYYAKQMGLPIKKLICASNSNNVLTDFIKTGRYDIRRQFLKTSSPSMDILISSNLERLIFEISGRNFEKTEQRMFQLQEKGFYELDKEEHEQLKNDFEAVCCDESEVDSTILNCFKKNDYLIDPHTAVALGGLYKLQKNNEINQENTVVLSTANAFKFPSSVLKAIKKQKHFDDISDLDTLVHLKGTSILENVYKDNGKLFGHIKRVDSTPSLGILIKRDGVLHDELNVGPLLSIISKEVKHTRVIEKEEVKQVLLENI